MENGYNSIDEKDEIYILFVYQEGVINRCKTYDVTYILKELV